MKKYLNCFLILVSFFLFFLVADAQQVQNIESLNPDQLFLENKLESSNPNNQTNGGSIYVRDFTVVNIVLAALSVMFSIFTAFIAILAFIGWTDLRQFKSKFALIQKEQKNVLDKSQIDVDKFKEEAEKLILRIKEKDDSMAPPAELKKYKNEAESLIRGLKKATWDAQEKISDLNSSAISSIPLSASIAGTISTTGSAFSGRNGSAVAYLYGISCKKCGYFYNEDMEQIGLVLQPASQRNSKCPKCGNIN
jgi:predicted PurR-regulated permease PerM/predicted nucleic-acid-binding Zn-ribbon protein